ncbi:MAG: hypothetical protein ACKO81_03585 [Planctomycetota bacterium]
MKKQMLSFLFLVLVIANVCFGDIQIDGYSDATNDRFTNSGSFIMSGYNLSGVGQVSSASGQGRWATLVAPNIVLSAWHYPPPTNSSITFYLDNDPNSTPVVRTVTSNNVRVGATDLWIGVLNSAVTGATYYNIADESLTGPPGGNSGNIVNAGSFQGVNAFMFGLSPKANVAWRDQAVGRNRISGYWENVGYLGTDDDTLILEYNQSSSPDYVPYESYLRGGDSGGPMFIDRGGSLVLMGTNAFVLTNTGGQTVASGVNYVGNQAAFIRNFIQVNGVPEPTAGFMLWGLAGLGLTRMRRRAA